MAKTSNVNQIGFLKMCGINFVNFEEVNGRIIFEYDMSQKDLNTKISEYYSSEFAAFVSIVEDIKSIVKQYPKSK